MKLFVSMLICSSINLNNAALSQNLNLDELISNHFAAVGISPDELLNIKSVESSSEPIWEESVIKIIYLKGKGVAELSHKIKGKELKPHFLSIYLADSSGFTISGMPGWYNMFEEMDSEIGKALYRQSQNLPPSVEKHNNSKRYYDFQKTNGLQGVQSLEDDLFLLERINSGKCAYKNLVNFKEQSLHLVECKEASGHTSQVYFDQNSYLLRYWNTIADLGNPILREYSEYKDFNGLNIATKVLPAPYKLITFSLNPEVDESIFKVPDIKDPIVDEVDSKKSKKKKK